MTCKQTFCETNETALIASSELVLPGSPIEAATNRRQSRFNKTHGPGVVQITRVQGLRTQEAENYGVSGPSKPRQCRH